MYQHWSSLKKLIWLYATKFRSGGGGDKSNKVGYAILKPEDTTLRYCRYDGGRASTALSPGKIDGWVVLASAGGEVTHRVEHDTDGKIILVPVNESEGER